MDLWEAYRQAIYGQTGGNALPLNVEDVREVERHMSEISRDPSAFYRFHHDYETFSEQDLRKVGADAYARHHSTEVLMLGWSVNSGPVEQWVPAEERRTPTPKGQYNIPAEVLEHYRNPRCIKLAWNKPFEWTIAKEVLGIETTHHHWRDPMVMAYSLSLPGSLDKAGSVVELPPELAKKDGTKFITKFSKPRKPTKRDSRTRNMWFDLPQDWEEYKDYNRNDVLAERAIYLRLKKHDMPDWEWVNWTIDQWINQAGIPINMRYVRNAIQVYEDIVEEDFRTMREITGLSNPNSNPQILAWLQDHGYPFKDLKKGHIVRALERVQEEIDQGDWEKEELKEVLQLRLRTAKVSIKKYYALVRAVDPDEADPDFGVLRNSFQFAGAGRTRRWAGRIFQAQNLPRPATKYLEKNIHQVVEDLESMPAPFIKIVCDLTGQDPYDMLTSGIRPAAQARPGHLFVDADLNAIENRVLGWMSGCAKILRVFEQNMDPYIAFGTYMFGKTYDELWYEYKELKDGTKRTISKPGVLGCGYMLGAGKQFFNNETGEFEATGLLGYAWNMGIKEFTLKDSQLSVEVFRREFIEVKDMWYDLERAAKKCVRTGMPVSWRMLRFEMSQPFLKMVLPSGRAIYYCRPRIEEVDTPWGEKKEGLTYEGLNDKDQWVRINTHGGKIVENADQAISRDLLAHAMYLAKLRYHMDLRVHVHDQAVVHSKIEVAERDLERLQECLGEVPRWAPGLPLGSAGFTSPIFIKD